MTEKQCTKCVAVLPMDSFSWKNKSKGIRSPVCKPCHRIIRNEYYDDNKQREKDRIRKRKLEIREWMNLKKALLSCSICGISHQAVIQFHHKDPSVKEIAVADAVARGWSKDRIQIEMNKCDILCANCHAIHHWEKRVNSVSPNQN